jgi:catechol 2,3-dioxygenase-like lactoylglutathione lyase family enzyme
MTHYLVNQLIPLVHVADLERTITFYELFGFAVGDRMQDDAGRTFWASLAVGEARLMFTAADAPIVPEEQAVIFYLYSHDVAALREHLLSRGLADGGAYCGQPGPNGGRNVVFAMAHPNYMPAGEIRVADPDGYCLLVGQLA